ncbi:flagellar assembly protein FliW [Brevibacillus invocatus]|uniref:flagellar assembly protein FliW n=1 Tax=Brevibacillus invocatus TaxID=173959 RepID=UPI0020409D6A|nr:flagellar assembly protein FliW [Brevibacillus invocatus]MCM3431138.1 flagellar assembly protein FliW [Brevibacillus invocatus]
MDDTANVGDLIVDNPVAITFPDGILGFEELRHFAIVENETSALCWLQSLENSHIAFPIISPFLVHEEYAFELDDDALAKMDIKDLSDVMVYSIVTIPENIKEMTVNLRAPLLVNLNKCLGRQIVLRDERYPIKQEILREG